MIRKVTSALAAIGIFGIWGFMAYFGLPRGFPWFLKPLVVVWSVAPFFTINLMARKWTRLRAKAAWAFGAAMLASTTLQGLYMMFIVDPSDDSAVMFFVWPFFAYIVLIPFVIAAYVFEHPRDD
ncbi:MAG TPA: hypothetical protein VJ691_04455 [Vicinamibacterales bacterium]|nr:hypothetical protein [Vicinamibacterales bacterium]